MNKLMGFYELKRMNLPSVPWKEYTYDSELNNDILWTIRTAVYQGEDLNLPRRVGVKSEEATEFANKTLNNMRGEGMVVYYPYFIAQKSGNLNVYNNKIVVEAVKDDLWNLVTYSDREVTIIVEDNEKVVNGNDKFLSTQETEELLSYVNEVRKLFRNDLLEGKSVLLEWSFALNCNKDKVPVGNQYLVFYEARTV